MPQLAAWTGSVRTVWVQRYGTARAISALTIREIDWTAAISAKKCIHFLAAAENRNFSKYLEFQVILKFPKHKPFRNFFFAAPMGTKGAPRASRDLSTYGEKPCAPWGGLFWCARCCSTDAKSPLRFLIGKSLMFFIVCWKSNEKCRHQIGDDFA